MQTKEMFPELSKESKQKPQEKRPGAHDATGRYRKLKAKLDGDLISNGNWCRVDTSDNLPFGKTLNFVDLFSGAGGLSYGLQSAGFKKVFSVEIDEIASQTIKRNFPNSVHICKPIEEVTNDEVLEIIGDKSIHLLAGGPPCQGFSVAGLRNPEDPRNQLFREYMRILNVVKPDYFVMENVPGILTMQHGRVFEEIVSQFEAAGYLNPAIRILEAAEFEVPQMRARAIFVGNRLGLPNPFPTEILDRGSFISIESAIDDLKNVPVNPSINHHGTTHSKEMESRLGKLKPGESLYETFRDAWKRQHRGVPSMAIKENHGGVHVHYELNRVLTAREMARLQTFPDDYFFEGTFKKAYWQIGNAVPCMLATHIGRAIGKQITESGLNTAKHMSD